MTLVMAFFITLAILTNKEHLQDMTYKILVACFPEKVVKKIHYVGEVIVDTYDKFLMSQIVEAVIIGSLVFVSYSLFKLPFCSHGWYLSGSTFLCSLYWSFFSLHDQCPLYFC